MPFSKRKAFQIVDKTVMVLSTLFLGFEVKPQFIIMSGDLCGRNGLKSKVSTLEELYDFSLKTLKNYIARCDFWSCRHFVDRLINLWYH